MPSAIVRSSTRGSSGGGGMAATRSRITRPDAFVADVGDALRRHRIKDQLHHGINGHDPTLGGIATFRPRVRGPVRRRRRIITLN